jgi:hypothetical protein
MTAILQRKIDDSVLRGLTVSDGRIDRTGQFLILARTYRREPHEERTRDVGKPPPLRKHYSRSHR